MQAYQRAGIDLIRYKAAAPGAHFRKVHVPVLKMEDCSTASYALPPLT